MESTATTPTPLDLATHDDPTEPRRAERPTRVRYFVLSSLALAAILSYVLRVSVSTAGTTIQRDLALDDVAMGDVFSGFFFGYFWFQVPAGWLGNRIGARAALAAMGIFWGAATTATALAGSFGPLYWSRAALGAGQAGLFAVTIMVLRDWFPVSRRGMASATITSCMSVGAVLANVLTVRLLGPLGWRGTLLVYSLASVAWSLAFFAWFRNKPASHPAVNPAERDLIRGVSEASRESRTGADSVDPQETSTLRAFGAMARAPAMWALCTQAFFQAFGFVFYITWFPAFLEKGRGVKFAEAGDLTVLPLIGTVLGAFLGGFLADAILIRTGSKWLSRCGVAALSLTLCAAATLAAGATRQPVVAVTIIAVGMLCGGLAKPMQWAATMDLTGTHSAVGFAVMNMSGNLGAILCPKILGHMFERLERHGGDWNSVLYLIAGIHLAAALAWLVLNPNRPAVESGHS
jgi:MFS family permease